MRTNTRQTFQAWADRRMCKDSQSIWTDGDDIYSYGTCIVTQDTQGRVILNMTKYSQTTTVHQNALRSVLGHDIEVDGLDRGVSPRQLVQAARIAQEAAA